MGLSIWHILLFAVIVILLFGTSKLKNLGKDMGGAIKDFRTSIKEDDAVSPQLQQPKTIEPKETQHTESTLKN